MFDELLLRAKKDLSRMMEVNATGIIGDGVQEALDASEAFKMKTMEDSKNYLLSRSVLKVMRTMDAEERRKERLRRMK